MIEKDELFEPITRADIIKTYSDESSLERLNIRSWLSNQDLELYEKVLEKVPGRNSRKIVELLLRGEADKALPLLKSKLLDLAASSEVSSCLIALWLRKSSKWREEDINLLFKLALRRLTVSNGPRVDSHTRIIDFRELAQGPMIDPCLIIGVDNFLERSMLPFLTPRAASGMPLDGVQPFDMAHAIEVALLAISVSGVFLYKDHTHWEVWYTPS